MCFNNKTNKKKLDTNFLNFFEKHINQIIPKFVKHNKYLSLSLFSPLQSHLALYGLTQSTRWTARHHSMRTKPILLTAPVVSSIHPLTTHTHTHHTERCTRYV